MDMLHLLNEIKEQLKGQSSGQVISQLRQLDYVGTYLVILLIGFIVVSCRSECYQQQQFPIMESMALHASSVCRTAILEYNYFVLIFIKVLQKHLIWLLYFIDLLDVNSDDSTWGHFWHAINKYLENMQPVSLLIARWHQQLDMRLIKYEHKTYPSLLLTF